MTGSIIGIDIGSQGAIALLTPAGASSGRRHAYPSRWSEWAPERLRGALGGHRLQNAGRHGLRRVRRRAARGRRCRGVRLRRGPRRHRGRLRRCWRSRSSFLTPAHWKRLVGIAPGKEGAKDAARSEAIRRWPGHAATFARVKDDGRAEAALIAIAGLMRKGVAP